MGERFGLCRRTSLDTYAVEADDVGMPCYRVHHPGFFLDTFQLAVVILLRALSCGIGVKYVLHKLNNSAEQ